MALVWSSIGVNAALKLSPKLQLPIAKKISDNGNTARGALTSLFAPKDWAGGKILDCDATIGGMGPDGGGDARRMCGEVSLGGEAARARFEESLLFSSSGSLRFPFICSRAR